MKLCKRIFLSIICLGLVPAYADLASPKLQTTSKMQQETQYLIYCLEKGHYLRMPITEIDVKEFFRDYMNQLDFYHLVFNQSEVDQYLERFIPTFDLYLYQGRLLPAFEIFKTFRKKLNDRVAWINNQLEEGFDFDIDEKFVPDRNKEDWPKNEAAADDLWRKRLKYDMLIEVLSKMEEDEIIDKSNIEEYIESDSFKSKEKDATDVISKKYNHLLDLYNTMDAVEIQELFLNSLAHMYDPHSGFLSQYYLEDFDISMKNSLVGIGALLTDENGYCTIKELIPGGPAEKSRKIQPNDKIIGVIDNKTGETINVIGMKLRKVVNLIRGEKGSEIKLLIETGEGDLSKRHVVSLFRDEIKLVTNLARGEIYELLAGNETVPIGVIEIPSFYGAMDDGDASQQNSTTSDVRELIEKLKERKVRGLILDVRRNGGGFLTEAISLTGLFIPSGPILQVRDTVGNIDLFSDKDEKIIWNGPLVFLVSRLSASATEIVAGALQDHKRAIIVGDTMTHGKGTVQAIYHLSNFNKNQKSAAKITIQKWYLPNGNSIQAKGINADVALPSILNLLPIGENTQDNVLVWDSIDPVLEKVSEGTWADEVLINDYLINALDKKSKSRQDSLEEFSFLNRRISWEKERQKKKEYSLNIEERLGQRLKDSEFRKEIKEEISEFSEKNKFNFTEVLLETALQQKKDQEKFLSSVENEEVEETEEGDDDKMPDLDIHLRESLRIIADWIAFLDEK